MKPKFISLLQGLDVDVELAVGGGGCNGLVEWKEGCYYIACPW